MGPFSVDEGRKMTATTSCAVAFLIGIVVRATSGQVPCSFEDGLCGWVQVNDGTDGNINGNVDWISNSGKTQTGDRTGLTGPDNDHTFGNATGKYLFFESSGNPNQKVTTAKLISPTIEPGIYCFRFWHHMYGSSTGKLQVNLNTGNISTTKWQLEHDQGRTWIESMVTLNVTSNSTVELKAIHNMLSAGYYLGDISIDDTNLEQGSCPDVSYNCTFEEANYCLWNRDDGLDELKTFWINNLASSSNAGPSTDKTLGTSSGRYLLLDTSATSPTLIASLYSNSIEGGQAKCLSFWYHMYGVNAANFFAKFEAYNESHKFVPLSGYIKENDQYGPEVYSSLMSDFDLGIVVALNRWIQITQIWSGSLNEWTLYVDGNEFDKKKTTVQRIFPTDYMVIGQSLRGNYEDFESCNVTSFNTHDRFSGTLSRFQMWDYALGGDELKEVLSGVTNYTLVPPGDFLIGTYFARSGAEGFSECASHCYSKDSPRNFEVCGENRYGYSLWSMDEYDNTTWTGLCQTGKSQSPINIGEVDSSNDQGVEFDLFGYKDVVLKNYDLLNDGHVIKLIIDPAQSPLIKIRIDGTNHTLKYLELHWPGEHMLSDNRESLEIYFVHQPANDPNGNYTILSVRYHLEKDNENRRNPWMDTLIPAIECVTEPNWIPLNGASKPHVYLSEFAGSISNLKNFYRYTGSLTTPPCTENVDY